MTNFWIETHHLKGIFITENHKNFDIGSTVLKLKSKTLYYPGKYRTCSDVARDGRVQQLHYGGHILWVLTGQAGGHSVHQQGHGDYGIPLL